ncbi:WD40-repeat-containing domain protein [Trichoderma asperelloides]|nr:WD40-repeat-containing domain protein [Trichoderma asperelloides]
MLPPASRDEFEVALVCSLPLEYDAISLLFDEFWDEDGDRYGRAVGDTNIYTTGRFGNFDVVLVLLPDTGKVSVASATSSLRSSYPALKLVILTGICGGVPSSDAGDEILLGDVVISKTVIQYDYGEQFSDEFAVKDTIEDFLGRPDKNIRSFFGVLQTARGRELVEKRAADFLEQIQNLAATEIRRKRVTYQYPGAASDKLFEASYRHKHHASLQCLCAQCHEYSDPVCEESRVLGCDVLGCDDEHSIPRRRLETKRQLEQQRGSKEVQSPSIFIGRFGSSDKILKSGEHRDWVAKRYGVLAFEMEGAGVWDELPCIIVKGVYNYADSHNNNLWRNFAAATAAAVAKSLVERYTKTDKPTIIQVKQQIEEMMKDKENRDCLMDLYQTDPRYDKKRIQYTKGNLLKDTYRWILSHDDFKRWRDNPQHRLLWIKGDPGKGKTMLLCGIIDEIQKSTTDTDVRLSSATARPSLISYKLFDGDNAFDALSKILMAMLNDASLDDAILVVDALNECNKELPLLLKFISEASNLSPAKWIVSSRNWPLIEENLDTPKQGVRLCLELNESSVSTAVQTYIRHKVKELADKNGYDSTTQHAVEQHLISNAHGTFLWVALVCQHLEKLSPLLELEDNYEIDELVDIIRSCGSFLIIRDDVIYFIHQSAKDFLLIKAPDQFLVSGVGYQHRIIFLRSLEILRKTLHRDMYSLRLPGFPMEQVSLPRPDPLAPITYSCIYWIDHFSDPECLQALSPESRQQSEDDIAKFFESKFLYWLEALSLLRGISKGWLAIQKLIESIQTQQLAELLQDASRFIHLHKRVIESTPLQVYAAALPKWILTKPLGVMHWPAWLHTLEGHTKDVKSIAFSNNSSLVASGSWDQTVRLWSTDTGDCLHTLGGHRYSIESLAFSHDSALLASGSEGEKIRLWRTDTGECVHILGGHTESIILLAFSYDSALLASGSEDETIRLWRTDTGECVQKLHHSYRVNAIAFLHDSSLLASASADATIRFWRVDTGDCVRELRVNTNRIYTAAFSYDLTLIASTSTSYNTISYNTIQLWSTDTGARVREIKGHASDIVSIRFSHIPNLMASGSKDGIVMFWRLDTGDCIRKLKTNSPFQVAAFSYDLNLMAMPWTNKTIRLWRADTDSEMQEQETSGRRVSSITFSQDSALVASALWNGGIITLCCAETGRCTRELKGHTHGVYSIVFSHDSSLLASASRDGTTRLWRTETGDCVQVLRGRDAFHAIAFSHDSELIASGSRDGLIYLWRTATGECVQALKIGPEDEVYIITVAFSHDLALIASALGGGPVRILRVATGAHVQTLRGHRRDVTSITFSRDSALVASASADGTIRLWRIDTGECVQNIFLGATSFNLSITSDNSQILTDFGSVVIDGTSDARIPAHFSGVGVRCGYSWITWNNNNILRIPVELEACRTAISGSTVAIGCESGRVVIIRVSTEELTKIYAGVANSLD